MSIILETARAYVAAGLSVIPIRPDGAKRPDGMALPEEVDEVTGEVKHTWKPFQKRLATDAELTAWFADDTRGIAIVCGSVSGGLEVLDFDRGDLFEPWAKELEEKWPGLLAKLPQVLPPGGGRHVYYRVARPDPNTKLGESKGRKTWIETRGEGGYVLAPGSPGACHPSGGNYVHFAGPPITETPIIEGL